MKKSLIALSVGVVSVAILASVASAEMLSQKSMLVTPPMYTDADYNLDLVRLEDPNRCQMSLQLNLTQQQKSRLRATRVKMAKSYKKNNADPSQDPNLQAHKIQNIRQVLNPEQFQKYASLKDECENGNYRAE